jgi:N-formylglutamate deformylase
MLTESFKFYQGQRPILVSMPHNGSKIPPSIAASMNKSALKSVDTDWYLDRLYKFAIDTGCYCITPFYSRYVIDLNRPETDENLYPGQNTTGLCPTSQFDLQPVYQEGKEPTPEDIQTRVESYWRPYHEKLQSTLNEIKDNFGSVLLFEAHSIKSQVPRFFDGVLPDFNFGNYNQKSCSSSLIEKLESWDCDGYSKVVNGRFKGGYITRAYGRPKEGIHSLQLELSQATYMDEINLSYDTEKANKVEKKLVQMFELFSQFVDSETNETEES